MRLRVQWGAALKWGAIALGALLALRVVPTLLEPPAPGPLPPDVGLPRVAVQPLEPKLRRPRRRLGRVVSGGGVLRRAKSAEGKVSSRRPLGPGARSRAKPKQGTPTRRQDPPATSVPSPEVQLSPHASFPTPEVASPPAAPVEASPPPDDGSIEFAPH